MFIEPEPRKPIATGIMSSGFFSSRTPIASPRDMHRTAVKRRALGDITPSLSQSNQARAQPPSDEASPEKPTVRLIPHSPSPVTLIEGKLDGWRTRSTASDKENHTAEDAAKRNPGVSDLLRVSDTKASSNDADFISLPPTPPRRNSARLKSKTQSHIEPPATTWHRRSASSGITSDASTLYRREADDNNPVIRTIEDNRHSRLSVGTTLHGTPTEAEFVEPTETDASQPITKVLQPLETLPEASPERATVRAVNEHPEWDASNDSLGSLSRPLSYPSEPDLGVAQEAVLIRRSMTPNFEKFGSSSSPRSQDEAPTPEGSDDPQSRPGSSPNFVAYDQSDDQPNSDFGPEHDTAVSSPNVILYSSPAPRPKSRRNKLHAAPSFESIESRLHYPTFIRTDTPGAFGEVSLASLRPSSSNDALPPLILPQKRVRHRKGLQSLRPDSMEGNDAAGMDGSDETDTRPYPRQAFSMHLSTIASGSERTGSRHLSAFSMGSGILTGDDSGSFTNMGTWPRRRSDAMSAAWTEASQYQLPVSPTEEELARMDRDGFRDESAVPLPLFGSTPGADRAAATGLSARYYDGSMPQIPPIPWGYEREESFDRITDLNHPRLRAMRSGQSLRQRSNSTPSQSLSPSHSHSRHFSLASYQTSSERPLSSASNFFPTWAQAFYVGGIGLKSPSKVSLAEDTQARSIYQSEPQPQPQKVQHQRGDSEWTDVTSRFGTSVDGMETESPGSSRFLPSIFRPRTRVQMGSPGNDSRSSNLLRSKRSPLPSSSYMVDSRPDSMTALPVRRNDESFQSMPSSKHPLSREVTADSLVYEAAEATRLPSLPEHRQQQYRPTQVPRQVQPSWDEIEAYQPSLHHSVRQTPAPVPPRHGEPQLDRSQYDPEGMPRLHPNKRSAGQPLSMWRAPSFVESLDSLVRARGNRQILLFVVGFLCPLFWVLGAVLPIPGIPDEDDDLHSANYPVLSPSPSWLSRELSVEDVNADGVMERDVEGDTAAAEKYASAEQRRQRQILLQQRYQEEVEQLAVQRRAAHRAAERLALKASWWRSLNRIMSVVGVLVVGAIIALAVVATRN